MVVRDEEVDKLLERLRAVTLHLLYVKAAVEFSVNGERDSTLSATKWMSLQQLLG